MNVSLTKFCKDYDLPKSSVYRRCQELGIDTANGLSPDAVAQLRHEFGVTAPVEEPATVAAVLAPVDVGNHAITLANPALPTAYSLETLRTSEAVSIEDPLAIAASFLQDADLLVNAMQQDIQARTARLHQTKQAKAAIADKARKLELEARLYQMSTQQLDTALSAETSDLQAALGQLQALGKPTQQPSQPESA